jgi:hypothetical protein
MLHQGDELHCRGWACIGGHQSTSGQVVSDSRPRFREGFIEHWYPPQNLMLSWLADRVFLVYAFPRPPIPKNAACGSRWCDQNASLFPWIPVHRIISLADNEKCHR